METPFIIFFSVTGSLLVVGILISIFIAFKNRKKKPKKPKVIKTRQTYADKNIIENPELIPKGKLIDRELYYKADPKDYFTYPVRKWYSWRRYKEKRQLKKFTDEIVIVRMEMANKLHREFLVRKDYKSGFVFKKKRYVFDNEPYFLIDSSLYCYDFHEDFAIPVRREVPIQDLQETLEGMPEIEVTYATNPKTLHRFVLGEVAQNIVGGTIISKIVRIIFFILLIVGLFIIIDVILDVYSSGLIEKFSQANK